MPRGFPHDARLVAAILAAHELRIPIPVIVKHTGVSRLTIKEWLLQRNRVDVKPDPDFRERFKRLFR
jgi:hypothetical protein